MPQPFKNAVMTNKGAELLSKAQAGQVKLEFTRMVTGSGSYQETEKTIDVLQEATGLKEEKQSFAPTSISVFAPRSVLIKALITNCPLGGQELTEGYYINEIGLFAKEKGGSSNTEVLYSISVTTGSQGDFMSPYNGYSPAEIIQEYYATVSNSAEVTIVRGTGAVALTEDLEELKARPGYFNGRGSIDTGIFYEDSVFTIEMEMVDGMFYIDLISLRLYWCTHGKVRLISPTDTPDWNATSGPGYIENKPDLPGRNAIQAKRSEDFVLTFDDPQANILDLSMSYFLNGQDFSLASVTISGVKGNQIKNSGTKKQVRIYAQVTIGAVSPGKKTINIYTYNGSSSTLIATGQLNAPAVGNYSLTTCAVTSLVAGGYVYLNVSGAKGDTVYNPYNLTFLTVDEI